MMRAPEQQKRGKKTKKALPIKQAEREERSCIKNVSSTDLIVLHVMGQRRAALEVGQVLKELTKAAHRMLR